MDTDGHHHEIRELDHRCGDGVDVTLLWSSRTGRIFVAVEDARNGDGFHLIVDAADALEAFHHPFAYHERPGHRMGRPAEPDTALVREG
jgi:hypothetical protein